MVAVLKDPEDKTEISLLFANQTEDDILLKTEIDNLQSKNPDRLKVCQRPALIGPNAIDWS